MSVFGECQNWREYAKNRRVSQPLLHFHRVSLPFGGRGYLYGKTTSVANAPTDERIRTLMSMVFEKPCRCSNPDCKFKEGTRQEMLDVYGVVHGQEITANVSLSSPFRKHKLRYGPLPTFFMGEDRRFDVTLRWNDNNGDWEVVRISG